MCDVAEELARGMAARYGVPRCCGIQALPDDDGLEAALVYAPQAGHL